ncbi:MAG: hypothetical protein KDK90_26595 [Leptospiraceae bacterium]|nr:hypothetical protein [Leptospiraceae bacterium]
MNILYFLFVSILIFNSCFSPPPKAKEECEKEYLTSLLVFLKIPENDKEGKKTYLKEVYIIQMSEDYEKCLKKAPNNSIIRRKL